MARHLWVNPERVPEPEARHCNGADLIVELSPYDVPMSIIGEYDRTNGRFTITFNYIDSERPAHRPTVWNGVEFWEGRYSGKLLAISVPVAAAPLDQAGVTQLRTQVMQALKEMRRERQRKGTQPSLDAKVPEDLLDSDSFDLLAQELASRG